MICFFIGHRNAPETLHTLLENTVEQHVAEYGVTEFVVGHYGRFDYMAARAVRTVKKRHPEVTLTLLLPYYPFLHDTSDYDRTYYPEGLETVPKPYAIIRANEHVIQLCDYLICYDKRHIGKTHDFVMLARRREQRGQLVRITNLAE